MITRFFKTSKPIHIVIIAAFTLIVFIITSLGNINEGLSFGIAIKALSKYSIILISMLTLSFLVKKNKLTNNNNYDILIYGLLLAILPITMQVTNILLANFFILLALRRIISLRSNINVKKKLFDAAFWIAVAALFHFWAILFFVLIIAALLLYSIAHFKNWIIPFVGVIVVILITASYFVIVYGSFEELFNYMETISANFSSETFTTLTFEVSVIGALGTWALIFYSINLRQKQKAYRPMYILILIAFLIGLVVIFISPNKDGSEFLFIFPVLAIIMANYLEAVKQLWLAELYVWVLIFTPITLLML
ncbi:Uncharacterized integral membrane protein [hydrothermal vent metagenome]|uniref:Uncharacterized integral membrane protein n=1 Tax=hydrothermal vent metagenome TaxID=652676 RepID=A0A3B0R3W6_9ZZZZ